ncbi:hypothetical protein EO238_35105, partial [Citrobacter sp. AAK_AS5]
MDMNAIKEYYGTVEGAVAAAVQARIGSSLEQAMAEARGALAFKEEHLHPGTPARRKPPRPA